MAKFISEDKEVKSSIEILLLKDKLKQKPSISWVPYKLIVNSANKELIYEKKDGDNGSGDYVLALEPVNEVDNLINGISNFVKSDTSKMFSFEAIEPSFELILEKSYKGYSVICWLDAGNVISDHYTWDGFGIRFFTNEESLLSFVEELDEEVRLCLKGKT